MLRLALTAFSVLTLVACATVGEQTRSVVQSPPNVPKTAHIDSVPFINQKTGYCGPATLAMVLQSAGQVVSPDELAPEVYTDSKKGSLQADMISAGRRHGMLTVPIEGMVNLLKEVAAGHPVIVLQNLGLSWYPQWHYAVVLGYDLPAQELILNSGDEKEKHITLNYFEHGWKMARYWGLVVLPPSELSTTADELTQLQAAVGVEGAGRPDEARTIYAAVLKKWPQSLGALIGLGNISYQHKEYGQAVRYLELAVKFHPESTSARHNLAVAEKARGNPVP
jgi:hypothetical protein